MKKLIFGLILLTSLVACNQKEDKHRYFVNAFPLDKEWLVKDFGNQIAVQKGKDNKSKEVTHEDTVWTTVQYMIHWPTSHYDVATAKKYWVESKKEDPADSTRLIKSVDSLYIVFIYGSKADSVTAAQNRAKVQK